MALSTLLFFVAVLTKEGVLIALLLKASKKVPKWGRLIHVRD
jgi:hypothetical protein